MQARSRLIQNVDGLAGAPSGQLGGQLNPLGFPSGQGRGRLSQLDIGKSHVVQSLNFPADRWHIFEEGHGLFHSHIQHIKDALALILHIQSLPVVPFSLADLAGHVHVRQEMHLDFDDSVAGAGFTAAAFHIEAETTLLIALALGVGCGREQVADLVEYAGVSGRVGTGRPPNRGLVDGNDLVKLL